MSFPEDQS